MKRTSIAFLAIAAAVAIPTGTSADQKQLGAPEVERVTLTRDWPLGTTVDVVFDRDSTRTSGASESQRSSRAGWTWTVERKGRDLLMNASNISFEFLTKPELGAMATLTLVADRIIGTPWSLAVSDDSARVTDGRRIRADIGAVMDEWRVGADQQAVFDTMITDESLDAMADDFWGTAFVWPETMFLGDREDVTLSQAIPQLGGAVVDFDVGWVWTGWAPCAEGEDEKSCVVLEMTSHSNPAQLRDAVVPLITSLTGMDPSEMDVQIGEVVNAQTVRVLAEPNGMRVRSVLNLRRFGMAIVVEGDSLQQASTDRRLWTLTWNDPAPGKGKGGGKGRKKGKKSKRDRLGRK